MTPSLTHNWAVLFAVIALCVLGIILTNAVIDGLASSDPSVTFSIVSETPPAP